MFKLNFSKLFSDFSVRRERTDLFIRTWRSQNKEVYAQFINGIDKVTDGDLTLLNNMYALMKDCVPPEAQSFYGWLGSLLTQSPSSTSSLMSDTQWAGEYTEKIAQCIVNRQLWLGINLKTGKVDIYSSRQKGLLMVKSGTPLEIWSKLPQYMKSYFIGQIDKLTRNSKGCTMLSQLERKQLYHALAFFANIFTLAQAVFIPGFLANLYDKVIENGDTLAYCMYYFTVFDHGLPRMMKILSDILTKDDVDDCGLILIRNCVHSLVCQSMEMGAETKASWEKAVEDCNPEIWKDVLFLLHKTKGKRGKRTSTRTLDEILTGDVAAQKRKIHMFLEENDDDICLAYLLLALVQTGKVKETIPYMTFHRAMEQFVGRHIGHDIPQKRYYELKKDTGYLNPYSDSCKRAKRIINKWVRVLDETG